MEPIVFYDAKRDVPNQADWAWSPNGWKTRYALNIKGLPYKTVFLQYVDMPPTLKKLGLPPNEGPLPYSIPTIYDPNTKRAITDSQAIILYLEEQYPDAPQLLPPSTRALQAGMMATNRGRMMSILFPYLIFETYKTCSEADKAYYRPHREGFFGGKKLEDIPQTGAELEAAIAAFEKALTDVAGWIDANGKDAIFIGGDKPLYADVDLASILTWVVKAGDGQNEIAKLIRRANDGRWVRYLEAFKPWSQST